MSATADNARDFVAVSRAEIDQVLAEVRHKGDGAGTERLAELERALRGIIEGCDRLEARLDECDQAGT